MMRKLFVLISMLLAAVPAICGDVPYTLISPDGATGLTIRIQDTTLTSGSPPSVSFDSGETYYTLADIGSGRYFNDAVPEGVYDIFNGTGASPSWDSRQFLAGDSALTLAGMLYAAGGVGATQLAAGCVTNAKLGANSVTSAKIFDGTITGDDIGNDAVGWDELAPSFAGSSPNESYDVEEMQDDIQDMRGSWSPVYGYTMGQMDSIFKATILDLTISSDTLLVTATGGRGIVTFRWDHTGTTAADNDSATHYWELWYTFGTPAFNTTGLLDESDEANIAAYMILETRYPRTRYTQQIWSISCYDSIFGLVIAEDWQGNRWGSGPIGGYASDGGAGNVDDLAGADGHAADEKGWAYVKAVGNRVGALEAGIASVGANSPILVYTDYSRTSTSKNGEVDPLPVDTIFSTSKINTILFPVWTFGGRSIIEVTGQAKVISSGEKGYLEVDVGGIAEAENFQSTSWTDYSIEMTIGSLDDEEAFEGSLNCYTAVADDTVLFRRTQVWLK